MTTTEAIRTILRESNKPLSILEVQRILYDRFGITAMDSIGRRIREMRIPEKIQMRKRVGAKHTFEYFVQRDGQ